ncbi:MAG TPA: translation initiation factor IF-3 [Candidatus Paceibacterota bacterium]
MSRSVRINHQIQAKELRVLLEDGSNLGVISREAALEQADKLGLDLVEISPTATPPVAKIIEAGKWQYQEQKKQKEAKAKTHVQETKQIQVKIGTGDHDLDLKAKMASKFLSEGHRVKIDLYLRGRAKYMDKNFLKERLDRVLKLITEEFRIIDEIKPSPKGLTLVIERTKKK